jgi:hypothetical protein
MKFQLQANATITAPWCSRWQSAGFVTIVTQTEVTLTAENGSFRVVLSAGEVARIWRATYGVDWPIPE